MGRARGGPVFSSVPLHGRLSIAIGLEPTTCVDRDDVHSGEKYGLNPQKPSNSLRTVAEGTMNGKRVTGKRASGPALSMAPVPELPPTSLSTPGDRTQRAFAALGSRVRLRILEALAVRSMGLPDLARELELNRTTLRYHLSVLQEQGWIQEAPPGKAQGSGRPAVRYRASPHAWVGFPERHFELLGEIALRALLESAGPDRTTEALRAKGSAFGRDLVQAAAHRASLPEWSPEAFETLILHGLFREFGVVGDVVARTPSDLTYRVYTCPFLELAEKMPGLVCDAVDAGFHEGIDRSMGEVATAKTACMGHGDPFCEYRLSWLRKRRQTILPRGEDGGSDPRT